MTPSLDDLIDRLEQATGPDRELDAKIATHMGIARNYLGDGEYATVPHYTASIDDALTLVPDGCRVEANDGRTFDVDAFACTVPLAICIAALKARRVSEGERS